MKVKKSLHVQKKSKHPIRVITHLFMYLFIYEWMGFSYMDATKIILTVS